MEYLHTQRVALRPYTPEDIPRIHAWFNDPEVTHYMFTGQKPTTLEQVTSLMKHDVEEGNVVMIAVNKEDDAVIGLVGLYEIHPTANKAEMRIIIGEKQYWGKGYGSELTEVITFYGFDRLNLHRIYLGYTAANKAAAGAYTNAGYTHEGVLRDDIYRNSEYYDTVRMGLLRDEYYAHKYEEHKKKFSIQKV